jgi:hypothetical protein
VALVNVLYSVLVVKPALLGPDSVHRDLEWLDMTNGHYISQAVLGRSRGLLSLGGTAGKPALVSLLSS